jgi:deazaflavin-dependent oxidoreductase (nitroreductase family)
MTRRNIGPVTRALLKAPSRLYDLRVGWLLGHRFLRLTHRGRKSGREYRTVLEVVGHLPETGEWVVVSGLGHHSDWFRNIQAGPPVRVECGRARFTPAYRILDAVEAAAVMADYEYRNRLVLPVLRAVLSRLLGWRYDSSASARGRLVAQLPFVAFRPRDAGADAASEHAAAARRGGVPGARLSLNVAGIRPGVRLVELRGELDIDGAPLALERIPAFLVAESITVLDASGVEFLDSAGVHALLVLARIARTRKARLILAHPGPAAAALIERTGANRVIEVQGDVADALEAR